MSQLTIQLSARADALVAQLQKEIFNRRRKKVSPVAVIETLVESGARCQSDKRFATSWANLLADIEKAAKVADAHGAKPANLSDEEWVMVLSHRTRQAATAATPRPASRKAASAEPQPVQATARKARNVSGSAVAKAAAPSTRKAARTASSAAAGKEAVKTSRAGVAKARSAASAVSASATPEDRGAAARPKTTVKDASASGATSTAARRRSKVDATASAKSRPAPRTSVARRMAKAVSRLASQAVSAPAAAEPLEAPSGNGVLPSA
jgi:hypothetical protein